MRTRGLTLLEMLVSSAVSALVITFAVSTFTTMTRMRRDGMRQMEVQSAGALGLKQLEWDLVNAGYHFPAPAFAAHIFNAPTQLLPGEGGHETIDQTQGCATGGLAPGSDAVEIITGRADFVAGKVMSVDLLGLGPSPNQDHVVVMQATTPFSSIEAATGVVLFTDGSGEACVGKVIAGPAGTSPPNITVRMLDRTFANVTDWHAYYPSCPKAGMSVFRLDQRRRYFVCAEPQPDGGFVNSLYRQVAQAEPGYIYDGQPKDRLQSGVEDLAVSARVYAKSGALRTATADCAPASLGGVAQSLCNCNASSTSACDLNRDPDFVAGRLTANSWASWVAGATVKVVALGDRPLDATVGGGGRPAAMDHPAGAPDGKRRLMFDSTVGFVNFTQVRP
jgi:prepilin-type N-terminal cleavage/methylation domain-containing protein